MYGEHYEIYGSSAPCAHCHAIHAAPHVIRETQRSRFRLMQLMAEMSTHLTPPGPAPGGPAPVVVTAAMGQKFMMGLLVAPNVPQILVAVSGPNTNNVSFQAAATGKGYTICGPVGAAHTSRVGRAIPGGEYAAAQGAMANAPGDCAAPRLLEAAFAIPAVLADWANWEMSEVYYQPHTGRRRENDYHWIHGLSAHSCNTCNNLLPLLMCPNP